MDEEQTITDEHFMRMALKEAQAAFDEGEIPVGAVVANGGRIIARITKPSSCTTLQPMPRCSLFRLRPTLWAASILQAVRFMSPLSRAQCAPVPQGGHN